MNLGEDSELMVSHHSSTSKLVAKESKPKFLMDKEQKRAW